jgi:RNA polymerase sigma-70 factor (ECF subfamily)
VPGETRRLLQLYVERFNRRDWDGLKDLIAADAMLRVADRFHGPVSESPYFGRYARMAEPLRAVIGEVDGEPAVVLYASAENDMVLRTFVRLSVADGRVTRITDYTHCAWVMTAAEHVSPIPARA